MIQRLGRLVEQVTTAPAGDLVPFVALENLGSRTGSLLPDTELPLLAPDPTGMTGFRAGDVLFGKLRPYLAKSWRADRRGSCSTELIVMRPRPSVDGRWLAYLAQSDLLVEWAVAASEGVKMPRTSWEKIRLLLVDAPTEAEQHAIADYLDRETAKIDALLRGAERLKELALERVWTQFVEAVTSATAHQVPLRRVLLSITDGPFGNAFTSSDYSDDGAPFFWVGLRRFPCSSRSRSFRWLNDQHRTTRAFGPCGRVPIRDQLTGPRLRMTGSRHNSPYRKCLYGHDPTDDRG